MSNATKQIKNEMDKEYFDNEMTNNVLGSFLITLYLTGSTDKKPKELNKFYKQEKRRWLENDVNEKTWMQDICDRLEADMPYNKAALVTSDYNLMIAPYENGQVLPLRRDGWMGYTLTHGTIYPIEEEIEYEIKEN